MKLQEFQEKIETLRSEKGWIVEIECNGVWFVRVLNKETGDLLAHTASTGLYGIVKALEMPFDKCPWV